MKLTVFRGPQFHFYKDTWDPLSAPNPDSFESRLLALPHGQIAQIALKSRLCLLAIPKNANTVMRIWTNQLERSQWDLASVRGAAPISNAYAPSSQWCHTVAQIPAGMRQSLSSEDFCTVMVIRNPFDRFVSCFRDKSASPQSTVTRKLPPRAWSSPEAFARHLDKKENLFRDGHWAPQSWQVWPLLGDINVLIRAETLSTDLSQFLPDACSRVPPPERHDHPGVTTGSLAVRNELSNYTQGAIRALFAEDFKLWFPDV